MRTAVLTLVAGRHDHLRGQLAGIARGGRRPDRQVVAAMADPGVRPLVAGLDWPVTVVDVPRVRGHLPLAAARNAAARAALADGAELLVFLDVDCVPAPGLLDRYRAAAARDLPAPTVLCGPVHYLPPPARPGGYRLDELPGTSRPHPARPAPADGEVLLEQRDLRLFWSLSFALTAAAWEQVGGFDEDYVGYGGEDTDFACRLGSLGGAIGWVGGATAYHQHHEVSSPPVQHLAEVVRNANLFHDRWGWWPMTGWLDAFAARGLAHHDPDADRWVAA